MKKSSLYVILLSCILFSCGSDDGYEPVDDDIEEPGLESPVNFDIQNVPYETLSEYNFFDGTLSDLKPVYGVLPYDLITPLFTDYALKSRFLWMPKDVSAKYVSDKQIFDFPVGTILIKNFYYNNVQPSNTTKILETRLMILKNDGWVFANYVWNDQQTEAALDMNGKFVEVEWIRNGETKSVFYRIPSESECLMCHKSFSKAIPIGPKPQNINSIFQYADGSENQLNKWEEIGYLDSNYPANIATTADWEDTSASLEMRVRSYFDSNCSHCHSDGGHCDYRAIRLDFTSSASHAAMGVCVEPEEDISPWTGTNPDHIITPQNPKNSALYVRINSNEDAMKMPMIGRSIIHEEAVLLVDTWINSLNFDCN